MIDLPPPSSITDYPILHGGEQDLTEDLNIDDSVTLNYVFIDPGCLEASETPMPITIPRTLFEGKLRPCREVFATEISTEFGLEVAAGKVKFWKPMESLTVDVPADPTWSGIISEFRETFAQIPFTRSLSRALQQTFTNSDLIHVAVTASSIPKSDTHRTDPPASASTAAPDGPPAYSFVHPMITRGEYETNEGERRRSWRSITYGERHMTDITITPRSTIPSILLGLNTIDIGAGPDGSMDFSSHASSLASSSFRLHVDSWGKTSLYNARMHWLVVNSSPSIQIGCVDTACDKPQKTDGDFVQRVTFTRPFNAPPKVLVALSGFSLGEGTDVKNWEIRASATNVDSRGFTINIYKEGRGHGQIHWLAFPEGGVPNVTMCSGDFRFNSSSSEGNIDFEFAFKKPPLLFVALNQFKADRSKNLRIEISTSSVTGLGMKWKIRSWSNTVLTSAAASFVAIEDVGEIDAKGTTA
ncbi:hypothetical protein CC2G_004362 [Coprinopsis cinerea AmutBmut pab1-1]|nr:hypothetical protein CC2G_004362 [Coprinopsis cinerea AmutBmut pab1-1]